MSRILYAIPLVGMPYEFVSTGSVRHSAPSSITQFLTVTAAKRLTHWYLGSAGNMMPYQHYIQIAAEESRNLRTIIRGRPPSAFATLGIGVHLGRQAEHIISDLFQFPESSLM
jgi:hypothetical protein